MPSAAPARGNTERTPLLTTQRVRRESVAEFATHVPAPEDVPREDEKHYNLVGLSAVDFWILCLSMWSAMFLAAFDGTIVATLLGPISSSFHASNLASWLGTAYLLSVCCFTPMYGRLCDIIGRQYSLLVAVFFFTLGNTLCAVAPSMQFLIAARAIAGVGGGGLTSVGSTIMSDLVPITHRGIFQGYGNIMFGMGSGLGAPLGGIISDNFGWRWAFYFQIPLLIIAAFMIWLKVTYENDIGEDDPSAPSQSLLDKLKRIDFLGCLFLAGFIGAALLAVSLRTSSTSGEDQYDWSSPTILGLFVLSGVMLIIFVFVELKVAAEPVLPVELLTHRTPVAIAINNFIISIVMFALLYSVPLFYTAVCLMSASDAGNHLIPNSILGSIGSLATGFLVRSTGRYYWLTFWCGVCGIVSCILLATWDVDTSSFWLWTSFGPQSFSMGSVTTLTIVALIADIGREHVAVATSLSYVFRTTGQVLGVSLSGALLQAVLQSELTKRITGPDAADIISSIRQSSDSVKTLPPGIREAATKSYQQALHAVFVCSVVLSIVGVLCTLCMREVDLNAEENKGSGDSDIEEVDEEGA